MYGRPACGSDFVFTAVGEGGLEPPHPFGHRHLKPARLPIPPLARGNRTGERTSGPLASAPLRPPPYTRGSAEGPVRRHERWVAQESWVTASDGNAGIRAQAPEARG